jgi:DNA polymerase-1
MILQVHDELVFDVHPEETKILEKLVKESMEGALKLSVPLEVEYKIAGNWLEAH